MLFKIKLRNLGLRRAGIFSKTSVTSSPSLLNRVPPQPGQTEPGSCTISSRGR